MHPTASPLETNEFGPQTYPLQPHNNPAPTLGLQPPHPRFSASPSSLAGDAPQAVATNALTFNTTSTANASPRRNGSSSPSSPYQTAPPFPDPSPNHQLLPPQSPQMPMMVPPFSTGAQRVPFLPGFPPFPPFPPPSMLYTTERPISPVTAHYFPNNPTAFPPHPFFLFPPPLLPPPPIRPSIKEDTEASSKLETQPAEDETLDEKTDYPPTDQHSPTYLQRPSSTQPSEHESVSSSNSGSFWPAFGFKSRSSDTESIFQKGFRRVSSILKRRRGTASPAPSLRASASYPSLSGATESQEGTKPNGFTLLPEVSTSNDASLTELLAEYLPSATNLEAPSLGDSHINDVASIHSPPIHLDTDDACVPLPESEAVYAFIGSEDTIPVGRNANDASEPSSRPLVSTPTKPSRQWPAKRRSHPVVITSSRDSVRPDPSVSDPIYPTASDIQSSSPTMPRSLSRTRPTTKLSMRSLTLPRSFQLSTTSSNSNSKRSNDTPTTSPTRTASGASLTADESAVSQTHNQTTSSLPRQLGRGNATTLRTAKVTNRFKLASPTPTIPRSWVPALDGLVDEPHPSALSLGRGLDADLKDGSTPSLSRSRGRRHSGFLQSSPSGLRITTDAASLAFLNDNTAQTATTIVSPAIALLRRKSSRRSNTSLSSVHTASTENNAESTRDGPLEVGEASMAENLNTDRLEDGAPRKRRSGLSESFVASEIESPSESAPSELNKNSQELIESEGTVPPDDVDSSLPFIYQSVESTTALSLSTWDDDSNSDVGSSIGSASADDWESSSDTSDWLPSPIFDGNQETDLGTSFRSMEESAEESPEIPQSGLELHSNSATPPDAPVELQRTSSHPFYFIPPPWASGFPISAPPRPVPPSTSPTSAPPFWPPHSFLAFPVPIRPSTGPVPFSIVPQQEATSAQSIQSIEKPLDPEAIEVQSMNNLDISGLDVVEEDETRRGPERLARRALTAILSIPEKLRRRHSTKDTTQDEEGGEESSSLGSKRNFAWRLSSRSGSSTSSRHSLGLSLDAELPHGEPIPLERESPARMSARAKRPSISSIGSSKSHRWSRTSIGSMLSQVWQKGSSGGESLSEEHAPTGIGHGSELDQFLFHFEDGPVDGSSPPPLSLLTAPSPTDPSTSPSPSGGDGIAILSATQTGISNIAVKRRSGGAAHLFGDDDDELYVGADAYKARTQAGVDGKRKENKSTAPSSPFAALPTTGSSQSITMTSVIQAYLASPSPSHNFTNGMIPPTTTSSYGPSPLSRTLSRAESGLESTSSLMEAIRRGSRFPLQLERIVYRISHAKLTQPGRELAQQVAISNLMLYILSVHADVTLDRKDGGRRRRRKGIGGKRRRKKKKDRLQEERAKEAETGGLVDAFDSTAAIL